MTYILGDSSDKTQGQPPNSLFCFHIPLEANFQGQEAVMNFLLDVKKSPKRLKKDVYRRRSESEPSFFDHFAKLNFVKRVWNSENSEVLDDPIVQPV